VSKYHFPFANYHFLIKKTRLES